MNFDPNALWPWFQYLHAKLRGHLYGWDEFMADNSVEGLMKKMIFFRFFGR